MCLLLWEVKIVIDTLVQDWPIPGIAFTVSVIGSYLGLSFAARARLRPGASRWQWIALAALSIGGMAVWSMHFIAMMGFSSPGTAIRYDVPLTVFSGLLAIAVIAIALTLTVVKGGTGWLLLSGVIAGIGVVTMHYTGMASMNLHGEMHHNPLWVGIATVIALVASTVALWFASRLQGQVAILSASVLMGIAVSSMHYAGMAGMHITASESTHHTAPEGAGATDLLLPVIVALFVFLLICSLFLLLGADDERPVRSHAPTHRAPEERTLRTAEQAYVPRHGRGETEAPPTGTFDDLPQRRHQ